MFWKTLSAQWLVQHRWYKLRLETVELPDGTILDDYFISVRPDVVLVLPINTKGEVVMVRQYKHAAQAILLEFPGGLHDHSEESPQQAALRELLEETGYSCKPDCIASLGCFLDDPTRNTNRIHLFVAWDIIQTQAQSLDSTENIEIQHIPLSQLPGLLSDGGIQTLTSVALGWMGLNFLNAR